MKLILMGTPDFVPHIFENIINGHEIVAVFTRPPKPFGRKKVITKSPVHLWAESHGFIVETDINEIFKYDADLAIVISYGVILRENVLAKMPFINTHFSLLPKYRGASPFQSAILNGDSESGVCIMDIDIGMDTGDIRMCEKFPININDNVSDVILRASELTISLLNKFLSAPNDFPPKPQIGEPTYTRKFNGNDEIIDWNKTPLEIHNQVRSIGGRTTINGIDVKILKTRFENNELVIETVQPAGKKPMSWAAFKNGYKCDIK